MEGILNVDGGDIVGQQHDLVGVYLLGVLTHQVVARNQPALQQAHRECARAGKGVEQMHVLVRQAAPELLAQKIIDRVQHEVDDLHRRVDNAQPLHHLGECRLEEFVVQLDDNALFALSVVDAGCTLAHRIVETLQRGRVFLNGLRLQQVEHFLHGDGNRVVLDKRVALKKRIKDRPGNDMLREHLHRLLL